MEKRKRYEHSYHSADRKFATVQSPYDKHKIAEVEILSHEIAAKILARAAQLFSNSDFLPKAFERRAILEKTASAIDSNADFFAGLIAEEGGKPLKDAQIEVTRAAQTLRLCAHEAGFMHGEEIPMQATAASSGRFAVTTREPIGVVFAISAFNHPLNLIAHQLGSAIAAGCPVLVKPASETPLSCIHLIELMRANGLPEDMAHWLQCSNETTQMLAESPSVSFLSFIGSGRVGWQLRSKIAPGTRLSLEHGGAAAVIVDETADIDSAVPVLIKGGFYHSGQVCVSVQRIFVVESKFDEFTQKYREAAERLVSGDPLDAKTDCGPLIRERDVKRVMEWIEEAVASGAKLLLGGRKLSESLIAPTLLLDVPLDSQVMQEEIFGPVVAINRVKDLDEGIRLANGVPFIFQSAIFTKNIDRAFAAARRLRATTVLVNDSTTFRADWMPFAGGSVSGFGIGGVPYSVRDMSREKLLVFKPQ